MAKETIEEREFRLCRNMDLEDLKDLWDNWDDSNFYMENNISIEVVHQVLNERGEGKHCAV